MLCMWHLMRKNSQRRGGFVRRKTEGEREREEREEREGAHITVIAQRYFIAFAQRVSGRRSA